MIGSMGGPGCGTRARGWVVALTAAVIWANACTSTESTNEETAEHSSPSPPTAEAVFERLLNEHQQVADAEWMVDPDDAYAVQLAEHGADLSECGFRRAPSAKPCTKPKSLTGDLKKNINVVLMLDASGSMQGAVGGRTKISIAKEVLVNFIGMLPQSANVALRVYGHVGSSRMSDKKRSCAGSEAVLPLQPLNQRRFRSAIRSFDARGWTPLGRSLNVARGDFADTNPKTSSNFVYVVSDGTETCGGNPVKQARRLNRTDIKVQVNIVGFDVDNKAARQLRRAARSGGGKYFQATDAGDLDRIFRDNLNWAKWTAYYNCKFAQEYRRFNEVFKKAYEAYNCVHRSAYDEFNAIHRDAYGEFNAIHRDAYDEYNALSREVLGDDRYAKVRDTVVTLAEERRDQIIVSAQRVRDYVVSHAQDRRDQLIAATQNRRDRVIVSAATQRDAALERAAELRDEGIGS
jgi:Ca-activated chloride channel family protein